MSDEPISADLARFLRSTIQTVGCLDVLLLVRGAPRRSFTAQAVAQALHVTPAAAERDLTHLCGHGFFAVSIGTDVNYAYRPAGPALVAMADAAARAREEHPGAVRALLRS